MRFPREFVIVICLFFLFASADSKKNNPAPPVPLPADVESDSSETPSGELLELLFQICHLVEKMNTAGTISDGDDRVRKDISGLLNRAVSLQSGETVKQYFSLLSQDVLKNDFHLSNASWRQLENRTGNLIFQSRDNQKKMDCFVIKLEESWTEKAGKYLTLVEKMKSNSVSKLQRSDLPVNVVYPILIVDLIATSGTNRLSLFHPPEVVDPESGPSKIIIFRNLAALFFDRILKPVADRTLGLSGAKHVSFDAYLSNLVMHKISHFLGPYAVTSRTEDLLLVSSKLGDLFNFIEEIKADTVAMCNTEVLIQAKLMGRKNEKRLLATYIAQLLEALRWESESPARTSSLIQIHFLLKNEGILFDVDSDALIIDFSRLKDNLKKLMAVVLKIQHSGSQPGAKQLIKEYAEPPLALQRLKEKMNGIPQAISGEEIATDK